MDFPKAFGKQSSHTNVKAQIERTKRHDNAPKTSDHDPDRGHSDNDHGAEDEEEEDENDEDDEDDEFPTSHDLALLTQSRPVISMTLDPSGSRLITATTETTKLHDFASMTPTTIRAFKSIEATALHHVEFGSASSFLQIETTAKVLSRDGEVLTDFAKGDMYLRDMHNTKGHISEITTGTWHPTDKLLCVTAGTDSTLRIWDVNNKRSQKEVIVHKSRAPGGRTRMTAVAWGSFLVGAALDGGIAMWGGDGPYTRPAAEVRDAHIRGTWTGGLDISSDGRLVVSRGGDDTIKRM